MFYTPTKFENPYGELVYEFPRISFEHEQSQDVRNAFSPVVGADYGFDFHGELAAPKGFGQESVRFVIVGDTLAETEAALDEAKSRLYRAGRGKLYIEALDGTTRWAWARIGAMPNMRFGVANRSFVPVVVDFIRFTDWYGELITGSAVITSTPDTFTITNPGNAVIKALTLRLRSNSAAGFTDPLLLNQTNGYQIATTRDAASVNDEWRIDTDGEPRVRYSTDNGATYSDDYDLVTIGPQQVSLMQLNPGDNQFEYTDQGTPDLTLEWSFYEAYH
jgi:hypothetical protein